MPADLTPYLPAVNAALNLATLWLAGRTLRLLRDLDRRELGVLRKLLERQREGNGQ